MNNFTITGFADEISRNFDDQVRVLKANGINHIEVRGIDGKNVSDFTPDEAHKYYKKFQNAGISVSSIGSPIGKINIMEPFSDHLEKFRRVLEVARIMKSPYIRMFSFFIDSKEEAGQYKEAVLQRWRQFLSVAKNYPEITLLHENEKGIYGDIPERCLELVMTLDDPQLKLAFDPANFVQCNVEVYPHAFKLLKEHIAYVHIKDAKFTDHKVTPAGLGDGRVADVLTALVANNFHGFVSLEPHLSIFDGFAALEKDGVSIDQRDEKKDGEVLFTVAATALKKILIEELKQEWK